MPFHHTLAEVPLSLPAPKWECGIFGRLQLEWQIRRDMDCPSFFLPRCVNNILFLTSRPKMPYFCFGAGRK